MVQKIWRCFECSLLAVLQLLIIGYSLSGLWPANAQTDQARSLDAFLSEFPEGDSAMLAARQQLWRLGEGAFAGFRVVNDPERSQRSITEFAVGRFEAACSSLGAHIARLDNPPEIVARFADAKRISLYATNAPIICTDATEQPLGALFAYSFWNVSGNRYAALFIMTPETSSEMLAIYHRAKATELRDQASIVERRAADEKRRADWRAQLAIGSETHCGAVVELRGPMVQVAYGTKAGWVRRERLYPMKDAIPCSELSQL